MSKKGIIFSIIGLIVVLLLLLGTLLIGMFSNINLSFSFKNEYKKVVFLETYDDLSKIDIDTNVGNVYIKRSDDDKIKVEIASKEKYVDVTNNDKNELSVNVKGPKCNFLCFNQKASRITIYLPKNYDKKVTVKQDLGDLRVANFKKLSLKVQNNLGDVKVTGVASLTGNLKMGDVKAENIYSYVNIKNNMGDIKIVNLTLTKDSTIKNNMGDIKIEKTNSIYIDAKTNMGDVKIKKNNRKGKYVLNAHTDMGDIKVNY